MVALITAVFRAICQGFIRLIHQRGAFRLESARVRGFKGKVRVCRG